MKADTANLSFEEAMRRLEEITAQLEQGSLPLEESLGLFEQGQALIERCGALLNQAELRLQVLREDGSLRPGASHHQGE